MDYRDDVRTLAIFVFIIIFNRRFSHMIMLPNLASLKPHMMFEIQSEILL